MAGGAPGGIARLLDVIEEHRAALRFDFRDRFGLSLDDAGDGYTFGEALDLVRELVDEQGTRSHAAVRGWAYALSTTNQTLQHLLELYAAVHRDTKKQPKPMSLGWPWPEQADVTEEEREALTQQLIARSALADR